MNIKIFNKDNMNDVPKDSFWFVSSSRRQGKSHLVTHLMSMMRDWFGACIVISPTSKLGKGQFNFCHKDYHYNPNIEGEGLEETLNKVLNLQKELKEDDKLKYVCVILDDVFTHQHGVGRHSRALHLLPTIGRHYNLMCFCISQSIKNCSPTIRNNCDYFISFRPRTIDERHFIIENFMTKEIKGNKKETIHFANKIMDSIYTEPFQAMIIDVLNNKSNNMLDSVYKIKAPKKLAKFKLKIKK